MTQKATTRRKEGCGQIKQFAIRGEAIKDIFVSLILDFDLQRHEAGVNSISGSVVNVISRRFQVLPLPSLRFGKCFVFGICCDSSSKSAH